MAAAQLIDYLENGNIKNSVNYPATYMARSAANRIVVLHENVPTMLAQVLYRALERQHQHREYGLLLEGQ